MTKSKIKSEGKPNADKSDSLYEHLTTLSGMMTTFAALRLNDKNKLNDSHIWATLKLFAIGAAEAIEQHSPKVDCSSLYAVLNITENINDEFEAVERNGENEDTIRKIIELGYSRLRELQGPLDILIGRLRENSRKQDFVGYFPGPHGIFYKSSPEERAQLRIKQESARSTTRAHNLQQIKRGVTFTSQREKLAHWLKPAEPALRESATEWGKTKLEWQKPAERSIIYAVILICIDDLGPINVISEELKQTEGYKLNKSI